jgi:hypothetical protein
MVASGSPAGSVFVGGALGSQAATPNTKEKTKRALRMLGDITPPLAFAVRHSFSQTIWGESLQGERKRVTT